MFKKKGIVFTIGLLIGYLSFWIIETGTEQVLHFDKKKTDIAKFETIGYLFVLETLSINELLEEEQTELSIYDRNLMITSKLEHLKLLNEKMDVLKYSPFESFQEGGELIIEETELFLDKSIENSLINDQKLVENNYQNLGRMKKELSSDMQEQTSLTRYLSYLFIGLGGIALLSFIFYKKMRRINRTGL